MLEKRRNPGEQEHELESAEGENLEQAPERRADAPLSNAGTAARAAAVRRQREEQQQAGSQTPVSYEQLLGSTLGPKLYDAVSDLITLDKLASYARSGLESSLGTLGKLASEADPASSGEIGQAVSALQRTLGPMAEEFAMAHGGELQERLQDFVDAEPGWIIAIALLAAAAAVAADMEIPELKTTFQVGGNLDFTASAKLGTIRNIAVTEIAARVQYSGSSLRASVEGSYRPEDERGDLSAGFDYKMSDDMDLYGRGRWQLRDDQQHLQIENGRIRAGVRYRPKDGPSIEGYGEYSDERGAAAGINLKWEW